MKKNINRNILWAELFVKQLAACGVKYACISPGSRSTPLAYAFANIKKIQKFVIIDERSSAFFALGLAKNSNTPVALITTSGTAAAELYPAIAEAYNQRTPLIICTADRPQKLYNCGTNQTINQIDIYKNNIRKFYNAGLPSISKAKLLNVNKIAADAYHVALNENRGPVHINFPFDKPFEPDAYTDKIEEELLKGVYSAAIKRNFSPQKIHVNKFERVFRKINETGKGIILCGPGEYSKSFLKLLGKFSNITKFPVFASGTSSARFIANPNVVTNYDAFIRADEFFKKLDPELIIQFGAAPVTKSALDYFQKSNGEKILINEYGDLLDPSKTSKIIVKCKPELFIAEFVKKNIKIRKENNYLEVIKEIEKSIALIRNKKINNASFSFEGRIIPEVISLLPENSNVIISNSMPVRDLEWFSQSSNKKIKVFSNRGASGIDGINSTALGIAAGSKNHSFLITGDLSFYHDLNGLLAAKIYNIPLTVILINNNGGAIFEMLPISKYKNIFDTYFKTPHSLNFKKIVEGYEGSFINITSWESLRDEFNKALSRKTFSVLQLKTNSGKSHLLRKKYFEETLIHTNSILNDN